MDVHTLSQEFKLLKKEVVDSLIENRKLLDTNEREKNVLLKPKVYSMNYENGEEDFDDRRNSDEDTERDLLTYSIRDYEEWEETLKRKGKNIKNTNISSTSQHQIAKFTYDKELRNLSKNLTIGSNKNNERSINLNENGTLEVQDDKKLVRKYAEGLNKTTTERYIKRMKLTNNNKFELKSTSKSSPTGYINDKNKDFNEKLDREIRNKTEDGTE